MDEQKKTPEAEISQTDITVKTEIPTEPSDQPVPSSKPFSQFVDGFKIPGVFSAESFRSAVNYKPRPGDLILSTYPKCGTTWAQFILVHIFRHGKPLESQLQLFTLSPFLEMTGAEGAENMPRPGAIKVHLPYHLTPRSDSAKYIYITRNPKDCCVSYFHHMRNLPGHVFDGTFDDFFEIFITGDTDYGDYFDHLLSWYEHRNDPNVLFMTYEEMKENPKESVLKMASFIDDELYGEPLRNDPEKLQNILKYSSFDYMKTFFNKEMEKMFTMSKEDLMKSDLPAKMKELFVNIPRPPVGEEPKKNNFVRKGIIGDYQNYFSEEQSKRMDEKFAEKTKGTDIPSLWRKYM